jgi:hypothetical protein
MRRHYGNRGDGLAIPDKYRACLTGPLAAGRFRSSFFKDPIQPWP